MSTNSMVPQSMSAAAVLGTTYDYLRFRVCRVAGGALSDCVELERRKAADRRWREDQLRRDLFGRLP